MELSVGRTIDPHSLNVRISLGDQEIKAAIDSADPDDLAFSLFLVPKPGDPGCPFGHAEYLRLVAELVDKVEQATSLHLGAAGAPEQK